MPLKWKPQSQEVYESWIEAVYDSGNHLTDWESRFLDSISKSLEDYNLTESQADTLENIYVKKS